MALQAKVLNKDLAMIYLWKKASWGRIEAISEKDYLMGWQHVTFVKMGFSGEMNVVCDLK